MRNLTFYFLIIIPGLLACNHSSKEDKMPVTTASETAKNLYLEAMTAYEDVYVSEYQRSIINALRDDPDFFMANYQLASSNLFGNNISEFKEFGERAISCKAKLSKGELLLKDALSKLMDNPAADVTEIGKQLVNMYPDDVNAYYQLVFFQQIITDTDGQINTLKRALEISDNPATLYNRLGYIYLSIDNNEEAGKAFDKYIELAPTLPNPYDSKGDYFMQIMDYRKAYESFMKANEIDSLWSLNKAMNAKAIADSLENE